MPLAYAGTVESRATSAQSSCQQLSRSADKPVCAQQEGQVLVQSDYAPSVPYDPVRLTVANI